MQLVGTDTRSFSTITTANYDVPVTISGTKPIIVECIALAGSTATNTSYANSCSFRVFNSDIITFKEVTGTVTYTKDVKGYKMFFPSATLVYPDLHEEYIFSAIQVYPVGSSVVITIKDSVNIIFIINQGLAFSGTVTINVYQ